MKKPRFVDSNASRFFVGLQALRELGFRSLGLYALYQVGLHTGYFRLLTRGRRPEMVGTFRRFLTLPERAELVKILGQRGQASLLAEADEIVAGQVRLFGGKPVPLELVMERPLTASAEAHWTTYELRAVGIDMQGWARLGVVDVKFLWEPTRFGWAYTLGRAYHLCRDERYPEAFWSYAESFLDANPPYLGPHWTSGQEVALRLIAFAFALQVFDGSIHTSQERVARLTQAIADHAVRIPTTLVYARAQNNNHLLTEAAGLYTAGVALPDHLSSEKWRSSGWKWFNRGLQSQIAGDGTYMQHSTNYHRLMLQVALWMYCLGESQRQQFPDKTKEKLVAATTWLSALLEPQSGRVPNLGPNDGAYVLPLAACPFHDYRPVLQSAASIFLGRHPFGDGPWDEMSLWLERKKPEGRPHGFIKSVRPGCGYVPCKSPHVLRLPECDSWAYLRVAKFVSRPGHADQLHLDLWWRGLNLAQDAGTYLYNALPPWVNALASSQVHNTVTVNGRDQMTRVGRFLHLDWAQAELVAMESPDYEEVVSGQRLVARHDGYRSLGVIHQRSVEAFEEGKWVIRDSLLPAGSSPAVCRRKNGENYQPSKDWLLRKHSVCVHWLLPDWPFEVEDVAIETRAATRVLSPFGWVRLSFLLDRPGVLASESLHLQIVRAGELVYGSGIVSPVWGWSSPTYGDKIPALSIRLMTDGMLPFSVASEWVFPDSEG